MSPTIRVGRLADVDGVLMLWAAAGSEPTHTDDAPSLRALVDHDGSALPAAEDHIRSVGGVRLQAIAVETEPVATGFWRGRRMEGAAPPPSLREGGNSPRAGPGSMAG